MELFSVTPDAFRHNFDPQAITAHSAFVHKVQTLYLHLFHSMKLLCCNSNPYVDFIFWTENQWASTQYRV